MKNIVIVGGDFHSLSTSELKKSGFITKFSIEIRNIFDEMNEKVIIKTINGGKVNDLLEVKDNIKDIDVLFWFPNISNEEVKILPELKKINPFLYLIQSKYNGDRYSFLQLVARALQSKSNLLLEFNKLENGMINSTILDPLGNVYYNGTDIKNMSQKLIKRLLFLMSMKRQGTIEEKIENYNVPEEKEFFKVVENYGETFHELIHAINQDRFLGNASFRKYRFRCSYGFPSFKEENTIFVSKRNVDKREINKNSFVPVSLSDKDSKIPYLGDRKPSVDTPIQRKLYQSLPKIKYMIHAHVYIEGAKFTKTPVPCGSLNEFDEIMELIEDTNKDFYKINLIGHGCIVLSSNVEQLKNLDYISREEKEYQEI